MFSATAIQKLTQLSRQLGELSQKPYAPAQTSEHSAQMITSTLEIINNLISHNEVKYWKKKDAANI